MLSMKCVRLGSLRWLLAITMNEWKKCCMAEVSYNYVHDQISISIQSATAEQVIDVI